MNKKVKYVILIIFLLADLVIFALNPNIWNLIYSLFFIFFMFDQFETVVSSRTRMYLCFIMMLFCFIDVCLGVANNNLIKVYCSGAFLLFLIWLYLESTLIKLARFFLRKEHYSLTLKLTNLCIFIYGKKPYILAVKGGTLNALTRYDEALSCLEESEKLGYDDPYLYTNLGYSWMFLENNETAYEYFKIAIDKNPNDIHYIYNITFILIQLEKYDEAQHYIEKALKLNEKNELFNEFKNFIKNKERR